MIPLLSRRIVEIVVGTQRSLLDRVDASGYAATSLTGAYPGMYTRDASVQALAMMRTGHDDGARRMLLHLARFGAAANLPRAPQVVPESGEPAEAIMTDQPDGNYMFVLAWARYARAHPQDSAFVEESGAAIARYADHYLDGGLWDPERSLLRNPQFEHSRELRFWDAYDLITNVFLSQALSELSEVPFAARRRTERWRARSAEVVRGVGVSLVAEGAGGRKTYAELIDVGHGARRLDGYSWVNFATVAAEWFAAEPAWEEATYEAYMAAAVHDWNGLPMLSAYDDVEEVTGEDEVIGKGLAWEIRLARRLGRIDRLRTILAFIEENTLGDVFAESYYPHHVSDTGNQEQAAWFIYEMAMAFPEELDPVWRSIVTAEAGKKDTV